MRFSEIMEAALSGKFWYHPDNGDFIEVEPGKEHHDYIPRNEIADSIVDGWVRMGYSPAHGEMWMECYGATEARETVRWAMKRMGQPTRLQVSTQTDDLSFEGPLEIRQFLRRKGEH